MTKDLYQKIALILTGLAASAVGAGMLLVPHAFHALSGITLANDVNLLSEVRAPGAALLVTGLFILSGAFVARVRHAATLVGFAVMLSYGVSRLISMVLDGMPGAAMVQITIFEFAMALICGLALLPRRSDQDRMVARAS